MTTTPGPTITPTRPSQLLAAALGVLLVARLALGWWQDQGNTLPLPGVVSWSPVALIALGLAWLARTTRATIAKDPTALDPQQAVTRLLLGKTSQVGGALLLGAYAALAWAAADGLPAPLAIERVVHAAAAAVACLGWAGAGRWLEAACRIPHDEDDLGDDSRDTRAGDDAAGT